MNTDASHDAAPEIPTWLDASWQSFIERIEQDRLGHALLLAGQPGIGKQILAEAMVARLLCLQPGRVACGECTSCKLLKGGAHPDRFILTPEEDKKLINVEQSRELGAGLALTTTISPVKVALIYPAEAMNKSAANALLKNLEEPPGKTVILLLSHDPSRLLVTIRSRCQLIPAHAPERPVGLAWLKGQDNSAAGLQAQALESAGGGPMLALRWLQEGWLDTFEDFRVQLKQLIGKPLQIPGSLATFNDVEATVLWDWLSQSSAQALRECLHAVPAQWLNGAERLPAARLARLQRKADRNRKLVGGGIRQDLLLQEWLLEWARLPAREELD
jgi:DNA polymerase-3 subunit delta'